MKYYSFMLELQTKWKITDDCMQMFYLEFLEYDNAKLNGLDERDQMKFFIVRWLKNSWYSKTSRYYYTYIKPVKDFESLDQLIDNEELE